MEDRKTPNYRLERIERLFKELRYEIERGMMDGEICEEMGFRFYVPISKSIPNGIVHCEFISRPVPKYYMQPNDREPRLKVVK